MTAPTVSAAQTFVRMVLMTIIGAALLLLFLVLTHRPVTPRHNPRPHEPQPGRRATATAHPTHTPTHR